MEAFDKLGPWEARLDKEERTLRVNEMRDEESRARRLSGSAVLPNSSH